MRVIPFNILFDLEKFRERMVQCAYTTKEKGVETGFVVWYDPAEWYFSFKPSQSPRYKGNFHVSQVYEGSERVIRLPHRVLPDRELEKYSSCDTVVTLAFDTVAYVHFHPSFIHDIRTMEEDVALLFLRASQGDLSYLNYLRSSNRRINPYAVIGGVEDRDIITLIAYRERTRDLLNQEIINRKYPPTTEDHVRRIIFDKMEQLGKYWEIIQLSTTPQLLSYKKG